jgi:hypothetical protein
MTSDDAGRELYSHQTPPTEWGCIIETPEGRHVRTDYDRWPWSGEGGAAGEHSDDYIARIGWRLARLEQDADAPATHERDALRRIVGEVDLALSGAPASGQWGPRALSVYDLMDAIDADDYSDADDAVRCAQAMAAVVRDVARERIAAEQDGGAS